MSSMSEMPQTPEAPSETIEQLPIRHMDMHYFSDMLQQQGYENEAVRYYGLVTEAGDDQIRNDNGFLVQDLEKVAVTPEVDETARQAIEVALISAQEAYRKYVEETLSEYRQIPFDSEQVVLQVQTAYEPVRGVAARWNQKGSKAQLVLMTDSGEHVRIARHRLMIDIQRLPQDQRDAVLRYAEENGLY